MPAEGILELRDTACSVLLEYCSHQASPSWVAVIIADLRTLNKMVFAYNTVLTMNHQVYDILEGAYGKVVDRNYISETAIITGVDRAEVIACRLVQLLWGGQVLILQLARPPKFEILGPDGNLSQHQGDRPRSLLSGSVEWQSYDYLSDIDIRLSVRPEVGEHR
ncbi:hypothetical protein FDECE_4848 [Fusarium decemcellulare]|nr:hypothetical protein FDECE_4848 [Fusarium decemcellulare]